jgi:hypothetical protein
VGGQYNNEKKLQLLLLLLLLQAVASKVGRFAERGRKETVSGKGELRDESYLRSPPVAGRKKK